MTTILALTDSIEYGRLKTGQRNEQLPCPSARCSIRSLVLSLTASWVQLLLLPLLD